VDTAINLISPVVIAVVYIALCSLLPEPTRQKFNALMIAGAGAVYTSGGGMGAWELAFGAVLTFCAYKGLTDYRWIGLAWLLHTAWDVVHHVKGAPIIPAFEHSSLGCALCDPILAVWMFRGAPAIQTWLTPKRATV
jgi:hypothetical protein